MIPWWIQRIKAAVICCRTVLHSLTLPVAMHSRLIGLACDNCITPIPAKLHWLLVRPGITCNIVLLYMQDSQIICHGTSVDIDMLLINHLLPYIKFYSFCVHENSSDTWYQYQNMKHKHYTCKCKYDQNNPTLMHVLIPPPTQTKWMALKWIIYLVIFLGCSGHRGGIV